MKQNNIELKSTDRVTIYYFGNMNDLNYTSKTTTVKTFKKWWSEGNKSVSDIAFMLVGVTKQVIKSYELEHYLEENDLKMYQPHSILTMCK